MPDRKQRMAERFFLATALVAFLACMPSAPANAEDSPAVPAWVFPLNPDSPAHPTFDDIKPLHVPNSAVSYTEARLNDFFNVPDWRPTSHSTMPPIVASGRRPDVYACGFCHTAGGQGRPENASLAGLPAAYIMTQVLDFKSGARKSAFSGSYRPADRMIHSVSYATNEELSAAADYFAAQSLHPRVLVTERTRVPRSHVVGWVYAAQRKGGTEPLGQRLLEFAPDPVRHEHRDDAMRYVAYVPRGSINRGKRIAQAGMDSPANACTACHGPQLKGAGVIPPIAGRSPTYILRQLLAFQTGARSGATGLPMRAVTKNLVIGNMIDAAAFAASLPP